MHTNWNESAYGMLTPRIGPARRSTGSIDGNNYLYQVVISDPRGRYLVGVDIGGTFTDCVILDSNGKLTIGKVLSTPDDFSRDVVDSLQGGAANLGLLSVDDLLHSTRRFFHACTVADNTLIIRSGARTGLVVTRGFPDTFLMMRGDVTPGLTEADGSHIAALEKPEPLAPRSLTEEVQGRIDHKASVLIEADDRQIEEEAGRLVATGVESVAVCLLSPSSACTRWWSL